MKTRNVLSVAEGSLAPLPRAGPAETAAVWLSFVAVMSGPDLYTHGVASFILSARRLWESPVWLQFSGVLPTARAGSWSAWAASPLVLSWVS